MPALDSPPILVARFLRANNYIEVREYVSRIGLLGQIESQLTEDTMWQTLSAFITEAGLLPDAGNVEKGDLTIEKILAEKKVFDTALHVEKTSLNDAEKWTLPGRIHVSLPLSSRLSVVFQLLRIRNISLLCLPLRIYCMSLSTGSTAKHLSNCYLPPQQTDSCIS